MENLDIKKEHLIYGAIGFILFIFLIAISSGNSFDIEKQRKKVIKENNIKLQNTKKEFNNVKEKLNSLNKEILGLNNCIDANSNEGILVDCELLTNLSNKK